MKLSEIKKQIEIADAAPTNPDGSSNYWDLLPRCHYGELPASLQKKVRERHTIPILLDFLRKCYVDTDFEETVKNMSAAEKAKLPRPVDNLVSIETITAGISDADLQKILLRARNTAIYLIGYDIPYTIYTADGEAIHG